MIKIKPTTVLAWLLCGVVAVLFLSNLVGALGRSPFRENAIRTIGDIGWGLVPLVFTMVGALIVSNQSRNVIGWLLMIPSFLMLFVASADYAISAVTIPPENPPFSLLVAVWFSNAAWILLIFPVLLIALLFPTGIPLTPRWRWVIYYGIALGAFFFFVAGFAQEVGPDPASYGVNWSLKNPIGFISKDTLEAILFPWWASGLGILTVLALVSLVLRAHRAGPVARQQIKWLLYACGMFVLVYLPGLNVQGDVTGLVGDIVSLLLGIVVLGFPIAIGIAILRHRLYDIDLIIRRTLTYALVTALLVIVFSGSVLLLQQVLSGITSSGQNEIVTVLSTLAIAALFVPIRNRIQSAIDKRFNRKKYNAQQVLNDFATTLRDETDLEKLTGRLMQVVDETMQPKNVSVWLKKAERRTGTQINKGTE